jgi:hypothetical protein
MGLDMYLEAEQYVSDFDEKGKVLIESMRDKALNGLGNFIPKNITYELGYWRKANAIHGWFVQNVQDGKDECQRSYVPLQKLEELKDICERVLDNKDLAPELLPTTKGFFFGDTGYDEHYEYDIQKTLNILNKILSNPDAKKWWIQYRASW